MRFARYTVVVAAVLWLSFSSQLRAQQDDTPYLYIPDTISEEAKAILRRMPDPQSLPPNPAPDEIEQWKAAQQAAETRNLEGQKALVERLKPRIEARRLGGVPVLDIKPSNWKDKGKALVYTHGGAYTFQSAASTLASSALVADRTGLRVISVDYTLAPQAKWRQTVQQVVSVFVELRKDGYTMSDLAIYGDSAGGGLAAGAVLKMRDEGMGMPAAVLLWSPWADITETGDTYQTLKHAEPFYTYEKHLRASANAYADPKDQRHPYVSPVYADYARGFPPTLIQGGTKEIFLSNFIRLYQALDMAGQPVKLDLYEGMTHVFQAFMPAAPESKIALGKSAAFLSQHLGQGDGAR